MRCFPPSVGFVCSFILVSTTQADASVWITAVESGNDVIVSGSGTFNLEAWGQGGGPPAGFATGNIHASNVPDDSIVFGPSTPAFHTYWDPSAFSGPRSFGTGDSISATSWSGDTFGLWLLSGGNGAIMVPTDYVSGSPLSGVMTFENETFSSIGLDPGIYTWLWSKDEHTDSLTLIVIPPATLSITFPTGQPVLGFTTGTGFLYSLQASQGGTDWTEIHSTTGDGNPVEFTDTEGLARRLYRVVTSYPP